MSAAQAPQPVPLEVEQVDTPTSTYSTSWVGDAGPELVGQPGTYHELLPAAGTWPASALTATESSATSAPTEGKVWASTAGAGAGLTVSTFLLWILGVFVWGSPSTAGGAKAAVLAVPDPVAAVVLLAVTVGSTYLGGWWAKHTPRPADSSSTPASSA